MKLKIKWLFFSWVLILSSCGSVNYMDIQTYNPAEITMPKEVRKVLIVNNAVTQSNDSGYEYKLYDDKPESKSVQKDSAMLEAVRALGYSIADASYFEDVLIYNEKLKDFDIEYLSEEIPPYKVRELCNNTGADAIIAWERLTFDTKRQMVAHLEGFVEEFIDIQIDGVIKAYIPDRKIPLATILVKDSLSFSNIADSPVQMKYIMPSTEDALCIASEYIAKKQVKHFVPHWENETRWVYNEGTSRWKEASAYMSEGKWDQAAERWKRLYEQSSKWSKKAKAASNLALYHEMNTDLQRAYDWAEIAYQLVEQHKDEDEQTFGMLELYRKVLNHRLELDKKLNMQIGQE